jgi:hypothetical protein
MLCHFNILVVLKHLTHRNSDIKLYSCQYVSEIHILLSYR